jgi:hypothetical protein
MDQAGRHNGIKPIYCYWRLCSSELWHRVRLVSGYQRFVETYCNRLQDCNGSAVKCRILGFMSAFPLTLYKNSISHRLHFSPEDGDSMFLRNTVIHVRGCTASQSRRTSSSFLLQWEHQSSHCLIISRVALPCLHDCLRICSFNYSSTLK